MIPDEIWSAQVPAGQHRVLLALWNHAHPWRPGDGEWFVWPSAATLAARLGLQERAVYARLADLERGGWITRSTNQGRLGWRLRVGEPPAPEAAAPAAEPEQLGLFGPGETSTAQAARSPSVDNLCTPPTPDCTNQQDDCTVVHSLPLQEQKSEQKRAAARTFVDYERQRAATLRAPAMVRVRGDVMVDGRRVDRWEQEAWERGGEEAVRADRRDRLQPEQIAANAMEALAWIQRGTA